MRDLPSDKPYANECNMGTISRATLRQKLKWRIESNKQTIKNCQKEIKENEAALKILDSNKELETLVNLMEHN